MQEDVVPAIAGLAKVWSDRHGHPFIVGLWANDLAYGLAWYVHHNTMPEHGTQRSPVWTTVDSFDDRPLPPATAASQCKILGIKIAAPSWSWASQCFVNKLRRSIHYEHIICSGSAKDLEFIKAYFIDYAGLPRTMAIKVRAHIGKVVIDRCVSPGLVFKLENRHVRQSLRVDWPCMLANGTAIQIVLCSWQDPGKMWHQAQVIAVEPVVDREGTYRRIGVLKDFSGKADLWTIHTEDLWSREKAELILI